MWMQINLPDYFMLSKISQLLFRENTSHKKSPASRAFDYKQLDISDSSPYWSDQLRQPVCLRGLFFLLPAFLQFPLFYC